MEKMYTSGYFCRGCYLYFKDEAGTERELGNVALIEGTMLCSRCKAKEPEFPTRGKDDAE